MLKKFNISKKFIYPGLILAALIALTAFSNLLSNRDNNISLITVEPATLEISVKSPGELIAENFIEITGPQMPKNAVRGDYHGSNIPNFQLKILDLVQEGTIVKKGDYVAQLDKTEYDNYLKGEREEIEDFRVSLEVAVLDSAVVLTNLRDEIKNQELSVEEAVLNVDESQFEPPALQRRADEILERSKRYLEQRKRSYQLRQIWKARMVNYYKLNLESQISKVENIETYLSGFTIYAPADGMVTYKRNRNGSKRSTGSILNNWDMVVATLPDLSTMISRTYISEIDISKIKAGQKVNIKIDALEDEFCTGTVRSIAQIGEGLKGSDTKMFEVQTRINDIDPMLRPGMTTSNEIIIKTFENVFYVPLDCIQTGADKITFVYKKGKTKQIVIPGESDDKNIIISHGLKSGDRIYLNPPEDREKFRYSGDNARNAPASSLAHPE